MSTRAHNTRRVTVRRFGRLSEEELLSTVSRRLSEHGIDFEAFVRDGRRGELRDDSLRDLWLAVGTALPTSQDG